MLPRLHGMRHELLLFLAARYERLLPHVSHVRLVVLFLRRGQALDVVSQIARVVIVYGLLFVLWSIHANRRALRYVGVHEAQADALD